MKKKKKTIEDDNIWWHGPISQINIVKSMQKEYVGIIDQNQMK